MGLVQLMEDQNSVGELWKKGHNRKFKQTEEFSNVPTWEIFITRDEYKELFYIWGLKLKIE